MFLSELRQRLLEILTVSVEKSAKQFSLSLDNNVIKGISIDERPSEGWMRMKIEVKNNPISFFQELWNFFFDRINGLTE